MIQDDIKFYLKSNLKAPSLEFEWTDNDNEQFFIFMKENSSATFLHDKDNLLLVRECFASYFENVGNILFKIKNSQIRLKVLPHSKDQKNSINVDKITNIIDENSDLITDNYNGKEDQIYLNKALKDKIFSYAEAIEDETINTKELVRFSVRKALELKDEDLIMLKKDSIFVKLCNLSVKKASSNKCSTDRRFNGIDVAEIEDFCKEHFSNGEKKSFFSTTASLFVKKYFLEKKINNHDYENKVFSLIQLVITEQLMDIFDHCQHFFKGLAGYIFRNNFENVFKNIAKLVLHEISISNDYMIDFLKYYSLNIVFIDGKRYKIPSLATEGDLKWNVISMLSIVKVYLKKELIVKKIQYDIDIINAEIMSLYVVGLSPVEHNKKNTDEINKIIKTLIDYDRSIDACYDSLKFANDENDKKELEDQITLTKEHMQEKRAEKKELLNNSISRNDINKFLQLENNVATLIRGLDKEQMILDHNQNSFDSIKNAVFRALISKKQLI